MSMIYQECQVDNDLLGYDHLVDIEQYNKKAYITYKDQSGTIGFNEFGGLWRYVEDWKRCFGAFDQDGSGSIDRKEMGNALRAFGYNLSDGFINLLINKFDKYGEFLFILCQYMLIMMYTGKWSQGKGDVTFDNFVQACVTVKTLTDSFRQFDTDSDGWIRINYESVC